MPENDQQPFDPDPVIAAIIAGDTDQFRVLVREYGLLVRGYIAARLYHQDDVEDLAQEVFVTAFQRIETCEPEKFRSWLLGIAKNHLLNHWRKLSRRSNAMEQFRQEVIIELEPELDEQYEAVESAQIERLLECIAQLPDRARKIVRAGLSGSRAESLSEELSMNANAIYQARYRAHAALKKCMKKAQPTIDPQ